MKKLLAISLLLTLLALTACKKAPVAAQTRGWWKWKSITYHTDTCYIDNGQVKGMVASDTVSNIISVTFGNAFPVANGTYAVVKDYPVGNEMTIQAFATGNPNGRYESTGGDISQKVNVTITNNKIKISGTGIKITSILVPDTVLLDLDITQL